MSQKIKELIDLSAEHINTFVIPKQNLDLMRRANYVLWPMSTIYSQNTPVRAKAILANFFISCSQ